MAQNQLCLPYNARRLFGKDTETLGTGSFARYKNWVEKDKTLLPYNVLREGRNPMVWRSLQITLEEIDRGNSKAAFGELKQHMLKFTAQNPASLENLYLLEIGARSILSHTIPDYKEKVSRALETRSETIFEAIAPFAEGGRMLDIGSGDGMVSKIAAERKGAGVQLIDVINYDKSGLPFKLFNGTDIPFPSNTFDISLASVVYHHADRPIRLLEETVRVTNKSGTILVIESVEINKGHRGAQAFADWFYNRIINQGVNCPFNFQTPSGWRSTFAHSGLVLRDEIHLGIDVPIAPEYHVLYVLGKK